MVATHTLTPEAHEFLRKSGGKHYIALEDHADGTKVYSRDEPNGAVIAGEKYWQISALNELLGF